MIKKIFKSEISGSVRAPPSKSITHRAIACACISESAVRIRNPLECDDTIASLEACNALGVQAEKGRDFVVHGNGCDLHSNGLIDCCGSGTTARLFTAISCLAEGKTKITGNESLRKRPMGELVEALNSLGGKCTGRGRLPLLVKGKRLLGGQVAISGSTSSQFVSALLIALTRAGKESEIAVLPPIESKPYISLTLEALEKFGAEVREGSNMRWFSIAPGQELKCKNFSVEGDFSSAAFLLSAGAIAGKAKVEGLNPDSLQGDRAILGILSEMGAIVRERKDSAEIESADLRAINLDASCIPDLVPVLCALATQAKGKTVIRNIGRLRLKESDRVEAIVKELAKMGAEIRAVGNSIEIRGRMKLKGAEIDPHKDHRIAMACAIAGLAAEGTTKIRDAECVSKSFPGFFEALGKIGGEVR
ncbi:MAG: 3-phosphoshikimate 1-carboxyvinyltransferase [Candidatus Diapherotrites archaeon]|nr:3-phosphoshikimate 1-carboxyvinyltransferase [Candidatus Diapherotrites archaeon]